MMSFGQFLRLLAIMTVGAVLGGITQIGIAQFWWPTSDTAATYLSAGITLSGVVMLSLAYMWLQIRSWKRKGEW